MFKKDKRKNIDKIEQSKKQQALFTKCFSLKQALFTKYFLLKQALFTK